MGLLIKGGTIVTATDEYVADILVEGEQIKSVGVDIPEEGHEVVDASGKYVFPGGVDEHVHMGTFGSLGFETSHAALVGGTTTIVDFAPQEQGKTLVESMINHRDNKAEGIASCDYSFHTMVMDNDEDLLMRSIPELVDNGISCLKFFMAYKGTPFYAPDELIMKGMLEAKKYGITMMLHCENGDMIEVLQKVYKEGGVKDPIGHSLSRPPIVEDESTYRGIAMAKAADVPLFVVHVSEKNAARHIREARQEGWPIYGETCTQYLNLDESNFLKPNFEGGKYVCAPALRTPDHLEYLWGAIQRGELKAVSSDNAANDGGFEGAKKKGMGDFSTIQNGAPGMQNRMYMLWTQGVEKGRLTRQQFVELACTNPAKVAGIYPEKGSIMPGADADIGIFDPNVEGTIKFEDNYEGIDYDSYEGFERKGIFEKVYLRGKLMAENGKFVGEKGQGKWLKQKPFGLAYDNYKPREGNIEEKIEKYKS